MASGRFGGGFGCQVKEVAGHARKKQAGPAGQGSRTNYQMEQRPYSNQVALVPDSSPPPEKGLPPCT